MKKNVFFFLAIALIAPFSQAQSSQACQDFINEIKAEYTYGWIKTQEEPDQNKSPMVEVFYYYKKGSSLKNPVIFFNGGPGFDSHSSYDRLERNKDKFGAQLDFIFLDQRGTGCSGNGFAMGSSKETIRKLSWYTSKGIVYDAEILRQTLLGNQGKWKIFGQSFGAYIVYRYLELYPTYVTAAYAHGNAANVSDQERLFNRILGQQQVLEKFIKNNPKDSVRLKVLAQHLADPNRCITFGLHQACGYEIMGPLVGMLSFRDQWIYLCAELNLIVPYNAVDEINLQDFGKRYLSNMNDYKKETTLSDVIYSTMFLNLSGLYDWDNLPVNKNSCLQAIDAAAKKLKTTSDKFILNECMAPIQFGYVDQFTQALKKEVEFLGTQFVDMNRVADSIRSLSIPLYVYAGVLDTIIPPTLFENQNKILGSLDQYTTFENSGHEGYYSELKVYRDLQK